MNCTDVVDMVESLSVDDEGLRKPLASATESYGYYGELLLGVLSNRVPALSFRHSTDWNYSRCFRFEFLLEPNIAFPHTSRQGWVDAVIQRSTPLYSVVVDVSAIAKFYHLTYRSHEMASDGNKLRGGWKRTPFSGQHREYLGPIVEQLVQEGFRSIAAKCLQTKMSSTRMELSEEDGYTTLYNCLFHDGYGGWEPYSDEGSFTEY